MDLPFSIVSTDFDGTLFAEFENPPIPHRLQRLLAELQGKGVKWVINTGRDMSSLMEALGRSGIEVEPDYLVLVEREIYLHQESVYVALEPWNSACGKAHEELFSRIRPDLPRIIDWINTHFHARLYEDPYSPFCMIAGSNGDADVIHRFLDDYCRSVPHLTVVRNDIYARFSHAAYNKGTALAELARRLPCGPRQICAIGDHLNDLPMLSTAHAALLAAPANAIESVKAHVRSQRGYVSPMSHGEGVADALEHFLDPRAGAPAE
jgi:hydroxymethylpyrimidine pyrophosphatase-like HAD family hydrolase